MNEKTHLAAMSERQPLLASVNVAPQRPRYRYVNFARIIAIIFSAGLACFFFVLFFVPSWKPFGVMSSPEYAEWPQERVPLDDLKALMLATPDEERAREWSQYYTAGPHLAGKNLSQAVWTQERFLEFGIPKVEIVAYDIYTNYPVSSRLGLYNESGLVYEAQLEEDALDEDPTTGLEDRIPVFHGYSASGNVTAEYVFANYGTFRDFEDLEKKGVNVSGKVVLCRYDKIFRGLKVKRAQELGAVGVLIYSDPGDDGGVTAHNGYEEYPNGPARHPSAVQRGSVQFLSMAPGDPTTIGYPSKPGVPRQNPNVTTPSIPSLPISYKDALPLLLALNGHGLNASDLGGDWGAGGLYHKGVNYNIGPAPNVTVNVVNEVEYVITPQWDVIATIEGHIKDETVLMGNHRDAWIAGGAADPNSGSAALIELARSFGTMLKSGWKPLRTIVLASWDGEEYGLLGSTEWVEEFHRTLHTDALAYLNVDVGARNSVFATAANPLLHDLIRNAVKQVDDPLSTQDVEKSKSVYEVWDKKIRTLGSGSDYTAFQDHVGIPSTDMGFSGRVEKSPVYHYHSNYDSFHWMDNFGDPGFKYHTAITKIWGLMALDLVETPMVRFNATNYASSLSDYLQRIRSRLQEKEEGVMGIDAEEMAFYGHLERLEKVIARFTKQASRFDARADKLSEALKEDIPRWKWWKRARLLLAARVVNSQYKYLDRAFLYHGGLDNRSWFKHVVYAPGRWTGYAGDVFPGIVESIEDKDWKNAIRWAHIVGRSVHLATTTLH